MPRLSSIHASALAAFVVCAAAASAAPPIPGLGPQSSVFESPAGFGVPESLALPASTPSQASMQGTLAGEPGLKIFVGTEGWYRITRSEMAAAGFDPGSDAKSLSLFCGGAELSIIVDDGGDGRFDPNDAIEFFGQRLETSSTGARTYWLRSGKGAGARIKSSSSKGKAGSPFTSSVDFVYERLEHDVFLDAVTNNGEQENFYGPVVTSDLSATTLNVAGVDMAAAQPARFEVAVQGLTENSRQFNTTLNGHLLGTRTLNGLELAAFSFDVPQTWLVNGANSLELQSLGDWSDASAVASMRLTWRHLLRADSGALEVTLSGGAPVSVGGFTSPSVRAIDVTDPQRPAELQITAAAGPGGFVATFTPSAGASRKVLVFEPSRVLSVSEMVPNQPSSWSTASGRAADFVIVTQGSFASSVAPLAALRQQEGLATYVVDVDDLYDEFNFGIRDPQAIRSFLRAAARWKKAPRYVLLVGDADADSRNAYGWGAGDFMPAKLVSTFFMKAPADDWYADLNDDGVPDLSIGRIPVRTAEEADRIIGRIVTRGTPSGAWSNRALFVSDANVEYDFVSMTAAIGPLAPSAWSKQFVNAGDTAAPRSAISDAMNGGQLLVNYIGHGTVAAWGVDYYNPTFNAADAVALTNGSHLPFLVSMECLNGSFHDAFTESMAETFLKAPNGGAIAMFASSTLTFPAPQTVLNAELYRLLFSGPSSPRIGDACRLAKLAVSDADVRNSWMLFGDPTMKLR